MVVGLISCEGLYSERIGLGSTFYRVSVVGKPWFTRWQDTSLIISRTISLREGNTRSPDPLRTTRVLWKFGNRVGMSKAKMPWVVQKAWCIPPTHARFRKWLYRRFCNVLLKVHKIFVTPFLDARPLDQKLEHWTRKLVVSIGQNMLTEYEGKNKEMKRPGLLINSSAKITWSQR
jgi:hypothetical protein